MTFRRHECMHTGEILFSTGDILRFLKLILGVKVTTPTCMVFGEVGRYQTETEAKCRMLGFLYGLCSSLRIA